MSKDMQQIKEITKKHNTLRLLQAEEVLKVMPEEQKQFGIEF